MLRRCRNCRGSFESKSPKATYCSHECHLEARRKDYAANRNDVRDKTIERMRGYLQSASGRRTLSMGWHKRRNAGRYWYYRPSHELPELLDRLRRTYGRFHRRVARGTATEADVRRFRSASRLMKAHRRLPEPVPAKLWTELRNELDRIDPRG